MRHGFLLNGLIAVGAAVLALASPWAASARADAAQATVVSPGGAQQTLSLEALGGGEDVLGRTFVLRSPSGEATQTVSGFSLARILEAAGADPYSFSYVEVQRPAGGAVRLSRHQALDPGAFAEGPPTIYATPTGTGFLRPSAGPGDANAADSFAAPQGVTITLRRGLPISVTAKASPLKTKPGRPVSFEAVVEGAGAGEEVAYSWYFDDGGSATAATAIHRFDRRGSYDVVVGVTTPGDRTGASDVVTVQVGKPISGPDRKGGGTEQAAGAPDHGAASGGGKPAAASPGASGTSSPAPSSSAPDAPAPAAVSPAPQAEATPPPRRRPDAPPSVPAGEPVSGELLEAAAPAPVAPAEAPAVARSGRLSDSGAGGGGLPDAAVGMLLAASLLGTGALVETRNLIR
jgi:PKD domain